MTKLSISKKNVENKSWRGESQGPNNQNGKK
jgi:hypothetical protein